jgi:hypothetical protein
MGYYAHLLKGDPFTIDNPTAVLNSLKETEGQHGHSWCQPVAHYRETTANDHEALVAMLEDYGFRVVTPNPDTIRVAGFDDSKLGGSWEHFWQAFACGTSDMVTWIMYGEDGEHFGEVITSDGYRGAVVTVEYKVEV